MSLRPSVLLAFCLLANISAQPSPEEQWKKAIAAAENSETEDEIEDFVESLRESLKIAERWGESDVRLLESLARLAEACSEGNCKDGEAEKFLKRALQVRVKTKPKDARNAETLLRLAGSATGLGKYKEALLVYREALDIQEALYGTNDPRVSATFAKIAWIYSYQDDKAQARKTMDYALELQQSPAAQRTKDFAELLKNSGQLFRTQDDTASADRDFRRAAAIYRQLSGPRDVQRAEALRQISWFATPPLGEELLIEVVDIRKAAHSEKGEEYNEALCALGEFYSSEKRFADAARTFETAIRIREKTNLRDLDLVSAIEGLAGVRKSEKKYREAGELYERTVPILESLKNKGKLISAESSAAELFAEAGDTIRAETYFHAMENDARLHQVYTLISTAEKLGEIYTRQGDLLRATEKFEIATATFEAVADPNDPQLPQKLIRLSKAYQDVGRAEDANRVAMRSLQATYSQAKNQVNAKSPFAEMFRKTLRMMLGGVLVCCIVALIAYIFLARRLDRKLKLLFKPSEELSEPQIAPEVHAVHFHGDGGDLFSMRVFNLLLSLMTLGVYSFWGKAKVRQYLCGQAEFEGDRFLFQGSGRELFLGWLKGVPLIGFIVFFPNILPFFWQKIESIYVAQLIAAAAFILLWPIARAGAYRYRMNRMSWRGIRFSFDGRTLKYFLTSISGYLLSAVTFGIYVPALFVRQRRILFNHTSFGDRLFRFEGRARDLLPNWICTIPLLYLTFGLFWPWWSALRYRYVWAKTTWGGIRFRCTVTGLGLLWLWASNFLLVIFTAGLAWSWASLRSLRFWSKHIELEGGLSLADIYQREGTSSAVGESFADFLGFDFGF